MNNTIKVLLGAGFAVAVALYANSIIGEASHGGFLVLAALFGAYMAMNIGANDVANNVGPAVGAGALTIGGAVIVASIFEALGALIAGGDVVGTIKQGIISPNAFGDDPMVFVYAMSAALLAAALWLNLATWLKSPVSTTHSIVGGVMGAGIAAGGFAIVSWDTMGQIVASWVISPILGGVIAAIFLYIIKSQILYKADRVEAAKKVVPILVAVMSAAFITYLTLKGFKHIWGSLTEMLSFLPQTKKPTFSIALLFGLVGGAVTFLIVKPRVAKKVAGMDDSREGINLLFTIPLVFAAAMLSFAHGANDVANAVGPLAAVNDALTSLKVSEKASIPLWVMIVGGVGISIGLALFGPRLIRTVGSEITELDQMRAFSIMMAAAITVVIASQLGLPVSSTHIAVGAVFGVGFLREWLDSKSMSEKQQKLQVETAKQHELKAQVDACTGDDYKKKVELMEAHKAQKKKVKAIKRALRENYVKRGMVKRIIAAWIITVPAAAAVSAIIFYVIKGLAA
ncbi:anion permease [Sulfurovum sp.]|jgi:PiT family inorganic phosphate transporter|uniref:inorganic phosphate transporter n=1 Tax=Sulfurovum sp. TaxID=1969726 RepID=UPI002A367A40|nr:anion permease [Sulfurovum sp.]MDY0403245.1 inorganic phosphate transporter [Sulfurovum sp.]